MCLRLQQSGLQQERARDILNKANSKLTQSGLVLPPCDTDEARLSCFGYSQAAMCNNWQQSDAHAQQRDIAARSSKLAIQGKDGTGKCAIRGLQQAFSYFQLLMLC